MRFALCCEFLAPVRRRLGLFSRQACPEHCRRDAKSAEERQGHAILLGALRPVKLLRALCVPFGSTQDMLCGKTLLFFALFALCPLVWRLALCAML
jgi:hypothetical protein